MTDDAHKANLLERLAAEIGDAASESPNEPFLERAFAAAERIASDVDEQELREALGEDAERSVIFVAHSLGGLLLLEWLRALDNSQSFVESRGTLVGHAAIG
jgi:hypothetical protein